MKSPILFAVAAAATLALPLAAQAQGIPEGAVHGAAVGNNAAGPIGLVVGGAVGGVVGGVEGLFGLRPLYASYPEGAAPAMRKRHPAGHSARRMHPKPPAKAAAS
jgi:hypothetical protein